MLIARAKDLTGPTDWSGPTFPAIDRAVTKLRWIDKPFQWHRNDGAEVFVVLDGEVDMHVRSEPGSEATVSRLSAGDLMFIEEGEEHVAHPNGVARVLVVERER